MKHPTQRVQEFLITQGDFLVKLLVIFVLLHSREQVIIQWWDLLSNEFQQKTCHYYFKKLPKVKWYTVSITCNWVLFPGIQIRQKSDIFKILKSFSMATKTL